MKERPIILSATEVRAALRGELTQVRRVLKHQPRACPEWSEDERTWQVFDGDEVAHCVRCPFGHVGDRLWCRETWTRAYDMGLAHKGHGPSICIGPRSCAECNRIAYRATETREPFYGRWRPSTQMPRWASRISLEVTDVAVERDESGAWVWVVSVKRIDASNADTSRLSAQAQGGGE